LTGVLEEKIMEYVPINSVWEITMACNMRCKHCGSKCTDRQPEELTGKEALQLCDDLAELGLKIVTLSGGEPLTRPDWPSIAKRLSGHGIAVTMISNGWLVDHSVIDKALDSGLDSIGISLDGVEKTHDSIRKKGAFARVLRALEIMKKRDFPSSIVTTVMKQNLPELPEIKKVLEEKGVKQWQLQIGMPMGNLGENRDNVISPHQLNDIIDFAYTVMEEGKIRAALADNVGYYTNKSVEIAQAVCGPNTAWSGCSAGKSVIGVLHDGRIVGCTSLRDKQYVEGSIRETPLREIWTRPGAFAWNRDLNQEKLTGFCRKCRYGERCLGGCSTLKRFTGETLSENNYCAYKLSVEELIPKIDRIEDAETLVARAEKSIALELYEIAEMCLSRAIKKSPKDVELLNLLGYVCFQMKDYKQSLKVNQKALDIQPDHPYSLKGLGLCLSRLGKREEGVASLRKSVALANESFMDPYHDLAVVLHEAGQLYEAIDVLEQGSRKSSSFAQQTKEMYQSFLREKNGKEVITDDWKTGFVPGKTGEIPAHLPTM